MVVLGCKGSREARGVEVISRSCGCSSVLVAMVQRTVGVSSSPAHSMSCFESSVVWKTSGIDETPQGEGWITCYGVGMPCNDRLIGFLAGI